MQSAHCTKYEKKILFLKTVENRCVAKYQHKPTHVLRKPHKYKKYKYKLKYLNEKKNMKTMQISTYVCDS